MTESLASLTFSSAEDLSTTAAEVAGLLGVTLSERNSSFRGGDYFYAGDPAHEGEEIIVQRNDDMGEPAEEAVPKTATLLYVERTERADALISALVGTSLRFVRREDWPVG